MRSNTDYGANEMKLVSTDQQGYGASGSSCEGKEVEGPFKELKEEGGPHYRPNGMSNFATFAHIVKANAASGILALPNAFSNAGILVGSVGLFFLWLICLHCMHMLVNCSQYLCLKSNKPFLSYADVADEALKFHSSNLRRLSKKARWCFINGSVFFFSRTVNAFLMMAQLGFCCVYVLFIAKNVQYIVLNITHNVGPDCDLNKPMPLIMYELCALATLIPFSFIKNIKSLAWFSVAGNVAVTAGIGVVLYDILIAERFNSVTRLPLFKGWATLPVYFGTVIYSFESIGMMLPLENKMREPKAFLPTFGVLNLGMVISFVLLATVGFYGYVEYGDHAAGSITLNLSNWSGAVVQALFTFNIFISYMQMFYVPMDIIGDYMEKTRLAQFVGPITFSYLLRASFVTGTFAIAIAAGGYLDLLISLIGAVASCSLAITFPPLLDIVTFWPHRHEKRFYWLKFVKNILTISLGLFGSVTGTIIAVQTLIINLATHGITNSCPPA